MRYYKTLFPKETFLSKLSYFNNSNSIYRIENVKETSKHFRFRMLSGYGKVVYKNFYFEFVDEKNFRIWSRPSFPVSWICYIGAALSALAMVFSIILYLTEAPTFELKYLIIPFTPAIPFGLGLLTDYLFWRKLHKFLVKDFDCKRT